jgi:hypothetical protein
MTIATDTARARAKLQKMLDAHKRHFGPGQDLPPSPTFLEAPKRVDIELALAVIDQLAAENEKLRHQAMLPARVNGDAMAMAKEAQP